MRARRTKSKKQVWRKGRSKSGKVTKITAKRGEKSARKQARIHDTVSRGGWAGAVIWRAGAVGDAVYTTASDACDWAGAVMQKLLAKCRKSKGGTDRRTDGSTQ